jgi:hypothetical protein
MRLLCAMTLLTVSVPAFTIIAFLIAPDSLKEPVAHWTYAESFHAFSPNCWQQIVGQRIGAISAFYLASRCQGHD